MLPCGCHTWQSSHTLGSFRSPFLVFPSVRQNMCPTMNNEKDKKNPIWLPFLISCAYQLKRTRITCLISVPKKEPKNGLKSIIWKILPWMDVLSLERSQDRKLKIHSSAREGYYMRLTNHCHPTSIQKVLSGIRKLITTLAQVPVNWVENQCHDHKYGNRINTSLKSIVTCHTVLHNSYSKASISCSISTNINTTRRNSSSSLK